MSHAWPTNFPPVCATVPVGALMRHPRFNAAKRCGDFEAARQIVSDLPDWKAVEKAGMRFAMQRARLVVVGADPAAPNQIPRAFGERLAAITGCPVDNGILRSNSPKHTGKSALARILARAQYAGTLRRGAHYVAVDDVMTQGGTISELRQFINGHGARMIGVMTMAFTNSTVMSDGLQVAPSIETRRLLATRFKDVELSALLADFGIYAGDVGALTESEARCLLRFPVLERLREALDETRGQMQRGAKAPAGIGCLSSGGSKLAR